MRSSRLGARVRTVAERGCTSTIDISPNQSPGPNIATCTSLPARAALEDLELATDHDEHLACRIALGDDARADWDLLRRQLAREQLERSFVEATEEANLAEHRGRDGGCIRGLGRCFRRSCSLPSVHGSLLVWHS